MLGITSKSQSLTWSPTPNSLRPKVKESTTNWQNQKIHYVWEGQDELSDRCKHGAGGWPGLLMMEPCFQHLCFLHLATYSGMVVNWYPGINEGLCFLWTLYKNWTLLVFGWIIKVEHQDILLLMMFALGALLLLVACLLNEWVQS